MKTKRGWWKFTWNTVSSGKEELTELNDSDLEHISDLIKQGFTEGEIVQEEES